MKKRSLAAKWGAIVWATAIAIVLILVAGTVLMPSTKRGRVNLDVLREYAEFEAAQQAGPATMPATLPQQ